MIEALLTVAFSDDGNESSGTATSPSFDIISAIQQGLLVSNKSLLSEPTYTCPTGNCTWPAFVSLAVCSQCTNISSQIETMMQEGEFSVNGAAFPSLGIQYTIRAGTGALSLFNPVGLYSDSSPSSLGLLAVQSAADPSQTSTFRTSQTLLWSLLAIYPDLSYLTNKTAWESTRIYAIECGLSLCSNGYNSTLENGHLIEKITNTTSKRIPDSYQPQPLNLTQLTGLGINLSSPLPTNKSWTPAFEEFYIPRTDFALEASPGVAKTFNVTQPALDSVISYLLTILDGTVVDNSSATNATMVLSETGEPSGSVALRAIYASIFPATDSLTPNSFLFASASSPEPVFENLAAALTSAIRNAGDPAIFQLGQTQAWNTYIQIRWEAFAGSALTVICGAVFLAICIWRTNYEGLKSWKDHPLPTLIAGLEGEARTEMKENLAKGYWHEKSIKKYGKELKVKLKDKMKPELEV